LGLPRRHTPTPPFQPQGQTLLTRDGRFHRDTRMAQVILQQVRKVYANGYEAVKSIDLDIHDGEFMVLVGPSGCAKSTTLRMIAGLEDITSGDLFIGERKVNDLPPRKRNVARSIYQNL